jgi:hypothetical protein
MTVKLFRVSIASIRLMSERFCNVEVVYVKSDDVSVFLVCTCMYGRVKIIMRKLIQPFRLNGLTNHRSSSRCAHYHMTLHQTNIQPTIVRLQTLLAILHIFPHFQSRQISPHLASSVEHPFPSSAPQYPLFTDPLTPSPSPLVQDQPNSPNPFNIHSAFTKHLWSQIPS